MTKLVILSGDSEAKRKFGEDLLMEQQSPITDKPEGTRTEEDLSTYIRSGISTDASIVERAAKGEDILLLWEAPEDLEIEYYHFPLDNNPKD